MFLIPAASSPERIVHQRVGQCYVYQLDIKSKRGGVHSTLESGPVGMALSKSGLLTWAVPTHYVGTEEHVIISIQDASGQQVYHTLRITPASR